MNRIQALLNSNTKRLEMLETVGSFNLPDCFIAAGFIRNLVWDHLHGYHNTPLNDVDVIFFNKSADASQSENQIQRELKALMPSVNWQVKNQAFMHIRNNDPPYLNSEDAMRYWPEKETAVAARLTVTDGIEIIAPFGVESLFAGSISYNPKRSREIFAERLAAKQWLKFWPRLQIAYR